MRDNLAYPLVRKTIANSFSPDLVKRSRIGAMAALFALLMGAAASAQEVSPAVHHDVSGPLHSMSRPPLAGPKHEKPLFRLDGHVSGQSDPVVQTSAGPLVGTTAGLNFPGVGNGDYGFAPNAAPPDTNGAVGDTQYVQWVNESFAVFNKTTGALVHGPVAGNSLWSGFGGGCQSNNDGDPIVQFDKAAHRWIFTQFSVSTTPYLQCVAVSSGPDAVTSTYNRYSFSYGNTDFPDYPKLGVWPDAYYISFNIFANGQSFSGAKVCAYDRTAMLAGAAATQSCFQLSTAYGGLLPSDLDGSNPPPAGSPNFFVAYGSNSLNLWKFHADFATSNFTLTGPIGIPVAAFSAVCGGGTCIPQLGTTQKLDSLADRLMYRLAYRNFGDHEALVANHSVTAGSGGGVRWYELRNPAGNTMAAGTPVVYQQGTYAPDSDYRWMGSIAMDQAGDIALGYSVSGSIHPSIRYTGRVPTTAIDPLGAMETENTILGGGGSQTGGLTRWGDYSAMTIDPTDDCTFFYTSEYLKTSGSFNWSTQIASFKFPTCGGPPPADFSLSANPTTLTLTQGNGGGSTITVTSSNGFNSAVALTVSGCPSSTTCVLSPTSVTPPANGSNTSTLTVTTNVGGTTPTGTVTLTISGNGSAHTTTVSLTVNPAPVPDFSISASPGSRSVRQGGSTTYTLTITPSNGFTGPVTLSVAGQPSGSTATFAPNPATITSPASTTSTLTVQTVSGVRGTFTLTIKGADGTLTHTMSVTLNVTKH